MKILLSLGICFLILGVMRTGAEEPKELTPVQRWDGSVDTAGARPGAPKVITNAEEFAAAWTRCERTDAAPEIDWTKNFALLVTTSGSRILMKPSVGADGDVKAQAIATRDMRPGFRYILIVLPRAGVKTVNGNPLP